MEAGVVIYNSEYWARALLHWLFLFGYLTYSKQQADQTGGALRGPGKPQKRVSC
ncbi:hypothetical protein O9929_18585 [Vibrio lentus]|nr:hypothetical protein [Vibrio lentus]